ncbi:hypothetical protein PIB30_069137 [Stylosanthes scabra]|uniref:SHSP domain-containing protein n=1 Tax=Stylosanthes scabra TaxID=79078 RepID=A0ABU6TQG7_9FABA|nr:hypothetical protein [Stylosanthes scabra]
MMESKLAHTTNRVYEDFDPVCKLRMDEARDTIELHLPGFKREQIRIQINHLGMMTISGERPILDGTKWKRFKKEIKLPPFCNEDAIHGSFMQNILTVVMPKKIPPSYQDQDQEQEEQEFEPTTMKKKKDKGKEKVTFEDEEDNNKVISDEAKSKGEGTNFNFRDTKVYHNIDDDDQEIPPETTREVALKFMLVIIVILVVASYLADMSKSFMAHAHSYFHN